MSKTRDRRGRRGSDRGGRGTTGHVGTARRLALDLVVVAGAGAVIVAISLWFENRIPTGDVMWVMALFTVAIGSSAALLGVLLAWLVADQRIGWLSVALACYCLLGLPASALGARDVIPAPVAHAVTVLAHGAIAVLLLLALTVPPALYRWRARDAALGAVTLAVLGGLVALALPGVVAAVDTPLRLVVASVWAALAAAIAARAARRGTWGLGRLGAGFVLLGIVQTARLGFPALQADAGLILSNLRLLGVALAFWGVVELAWRALADLGTVAAEQEEELRLAELQLARAAERDHELRNGLAGLVGVTTVLNGARPDAKRLTSVVASELTRLNHLLDARADPVHGPRSAYAVGPVLSGLVTLRSSSGMDLTVDAVPDLYALGSSRTLAQVVTNLLANAARHAPGSPVRMTARRQEGRIVVEVRDSGPGITPGREEVVFTSGERDPDAGGRGLGLAVCRRQHAVEDATITIRPADPARPGCCVVIELPACPLAIQETARFPRDRAGQTPP